MKTIYKMILLAALPVLALTSCKDEEPEAEAQTYFEFAETTLDVSRSEGSGTVDIKWTRTSERGATLTLEVTTAGLSNPAAPADYTISELPVVFAAGEKSKTLTITPAAGSTGEKSFYLYMKSSTLGNDVGLGKPGKDTNKCLITLKD